MVVVIVVVVAVAVVVVAETAASSSWRAASVALGMSGEPQSRDQQHHFSCIHEISFWTKYQPNQCCTFALFKTYYSNMIKHYKSFNFFGLHFRIIISKLIKRK